MKVLLIALLIISILSVPLSSASVMDAPSSVENATAVMMSTQGVSNVKQLNCTKISDKEFEVLGDALMEKMVGSHELHEQMDVMMGGEGSESLAGMHTVMGQNWLGCHSMQSMMGSNMMPMMRMMGNQYPAYYGRYDATLILGTSGWVLFFVSILFIIFIYKGKIRIHKK